MTKVDIVSGFLGAGKTTLIKKLLQEVLMDEQVILVENEYGEVGIDGGFLKDTGIEIKELNSGCICCTLVGDFEKSLTEVIETYHPDRILIEPSGVGKLSDVLGAVKKVEKNYSNVKVNALVTVANAKKASKQMKAFGEFFTNQVENASTIVLSRTQNMTQDKLEACVKELQAVNPKAVIITTPWDQITGQQIMKAMEQQDELTEELVRETKEAEEHHHHHHHHDHDHEHEQEEHEHDHDEHEHEHHHDHEECCDEDHDADDVFTSWGRETPHVYTKEKIENILKTLSETEQYGDILRAKGMVPSEDGSWIYFDMVPGEYELRGGDPEYTGRFCVIGCDLDEKGLEKLFELV